MTDIEKGWAELRNRCCADPTEAKRCVMVSRDDFAAAIAAMQPAPHEPVAWMYTYMHGGVRLRIRRSSKYPSEDGWHEHALYAFPTPPAGGSDATS